jgi:hypothetical protein
MIGVPAVVSAVCGNPAGANRLIGPAFMLQVQACLIVILGLMASVTRMPVGLFFLGFFVIAIAHKLAER